MLARLRRVLAASPPLQDAPVGVIYSCASGRRPGMAAYDWIGCDDYAAACRVNGPSAAYDDLARAMRPEQRLMVVPGGADPWRQDPACFDALAHPDPPSVLLAAWGWYRNRPAVNIKPDAGPTITISNTDHDYAADSDPDAELETEAHGDTGHCPPLSV